MGLLPPFAVLVFVSRLQSIALARTQHPCYYSADQLASDNLLPCYASTYSDHYSCCMAGDVCIEHNACHDADTGVTYQYACTDSTFQHESCPRKCGLDTNKSPWVGLVFCDGSNGTPNDTWVCNHPENCGEKDDCEERVWDAELKSLDGTCCEDLKHGKEYVAFYGSSTLVDILVLPTSPKLSSWWEQHADRVKSTVISTPTLQANTTSNSIPNSSYPTSTALTPHPQTSTATTPPTPSIHTTTTTTTSSPPQLPKKPEIPASKRSALCISLSLGLGIPIILGLIYTGIYFHMKQTHQTRYPTRCPTSANANVNVNVNVDTYTNEKQTPPPPEPTHELEASSPVMEGSNSLSPAQNIGLSSLEPVFHTPRRQRDNKTYQDAQCAQANAWNMHLDRNAYHQFPYGRPYRVPRVQVHCAPYPPPPLYSSFRGVDAQEKFSSGEQIKVYLENPHAHAYDRACDLRQC